MRVVFRKYDGAMHWHYSGQYLGAGEHGRWVGVPAGATMRRGDEVTITAGSDGGVLFPADEWWAADGVRTRRAVRADRPALGGANRRDR